MSFDEPAEKALSIDIERVEIVIDEDHPERVEIYMLDDLGNRVEGGTFKKSDFMNVVLDFYNKNY